MDAKPSLDYSDLLKTYDHNRKITTQLCNEIVTTLVKDEINEAGQRLGIMRGGILVFGSEHETSVLMDFAIRHLFRDGKNAIERFPERTKRRLDQEEFDALRRMAQSRYRIIDIDRVEPGVGVLVTDRLRKESGLVVDHGLAISAQFGAVMGANIVDWDGYWATTGAGLPMDDRTWNRLDRPIQKRFGKPGAKLRNLDRSQEADLAAWCTRGCLEAGMSEKIVYQ